MRKFDAVRFCGNQFSEMKIIFLANPVIKIVKMVGGKKWWVDSSCQKMSLLYG